MKTDEDYRKLEEDVRKLGLPTPEDLMDEMALGLKSSENAVARAMGEVLTIKGRINKKHGEVSPEESRKLMPFELRDILKDLSSEESVSFVLSLSGFSRIFNSMAQSVLMADPGLMFALVLGGAMDIVAGDEEDEG